MENSFSFWVNQMNMCCLRAAAVNLLLSRIRLRVPSNRGVLGPCPVSSVCSLVLSPCVSSLRLSSSPSISLFQSSSHHSNWLCLALSEIWLCFARTPLIARRSRVALVVHLAVLTLKQSWRAVGFELSLPGVFLRRRFPPSISSDCFLSVLSRGCTLSLRP